VDFKIICYNKEMENNHGSLKSQDTLVLCSLIFDPDLMQKEISSLTSLSTSEISLSFKRLRHARLMNSNAQILVYEHCLEFFVHAVKFLFPPLLGGEVVGMKTASSFKKFSISKSEHSMDVVWPFLKGDTKGLAVYPIHENVPSFCCNRIEYYEFFASLDLIRVGKARERSIGKNVLKSFVEHSAREKNMKRHGLSR